MAGILVTMPEMDSNGVGAPEFAGGMTPRVANEKGFKRLEAVQGMEIVSRHLQFIQAGRVVQRIEPDEQAPLHPGVDLRRSSCSEQIRERLVPERLDHDEM